ncbi:hypothetical protein BDK51DRAFT_41319 [Blyttiomyces helicus]|uniref:RNase H type-1 domain-containing protein n=1 Tax=Blyttiomyces helicus TaxID=388810 RepID=A0A4P9W1A6_9FUNG|nr:hypothetical protein BDK51DRAFT_41319 [Blyttiomyces helicus]|eukprot:RKO85125.1 hypothetical protein BDK51DRAFT_41319 [Blyttiomyces helicus]
MTDLYEYYAADPSLDAHTGVSELYGYRIVHVDGSCLDNGSTNARAGMGLYYGRDSPLNAAVQYLLANPMNNGSEVMAAAAVMAVVWSETAECRMPMYKTLCIATDSTYVMHEAAKVASSRRFNAEAWAFYDTALQQLRNIGIDMILLKVKGHDTSLENNEAD